MLDTARILSRHLPALLVVLALYALLLLAVVALARGRVAAPSGWRTGRGLDLLHVDRIAFVVVPIAGLLGPLAYALLTHFPLHPRHLMFLAPVAPVLLARLLTAPGRMRWVAIAAALVQTGALLNLSFKDVYGKDDERGAVRWAESRSIGAACIVGDAAPLYALRVQGLVEPLVDLTDPALCTGIDDLWWLENRTWEDPEGRVGRKLERLAGARGLRPLPSDDRFQGIVLHHWSRAAEEPRP
jgi:hypothetical protein